uniref:Adhesion G protein-coupled receptor D2 n=1 Tax=Varanus komodoensis TaxID=61221 RepID=A0A8D2LXL2_VARKO
MLIILPRCVRFVKSCRSGIVIILIHPSMNPNIPPVDLQGIQHGSQNPPHYILMTPLCSRSRLAFAYGRLEGAILVFASASPAPPWHRGPSPPLSPGSHPALVLAFQDKTDTKFAKVRASFPALPALSACAHVQWDPGAAEVSTVFSYAVPAFINEFQLRGFVDEEGFVRFAVILHGHHSPYLPVFRADGRWHHFCVTWQEHGGAWAVFADGKRRAAATGLLASRAIGGRGTFIIGQDQDSLGGTFKKKESFSGNLTGLHLWRRVLSRGQVEGVRSCVPVVEGLLFAWDSSILEVEPSLLQATVQLTCPGKTLSGWDYSTRRNSSAPQTRESFYLLQIPESVFQAEVQAINISAASDYLGVVEAVLSEVEPPQLDAAALLGVYQLLKKVSDVEADTPEQLPALEQLGQSFVQVAGILLEEENAEEWAEIKPRAISLPLERDPPTHTHIIVGTGASQVNNSLGLAWELDYSESSLGPFRLVPAPLWHFRQEFPQPSSIWAPSVDKLGTLRTGCAHGLSFLPPRRRSPEGAGGWSTTGCGALASHADIMLCACNHTTNFAVLLQLYEVQRSAEEEATLKTLTFVGCGVSFCALIVTLVLFLAIGVPKSERTTVHKNLIFALAAAEALLMCSELAKTNQGVCFAVTAFLHLFFMAAFAWMLVEGLLLWSKVVAVNMSEDRRMRFYYVTGWGLPVVIVGVTLATSFNKYVADNHCWLNVQTDIIWAFVGPVLFVLMVNTVVLFRVVMVTVSSARRRSRMLTPNSSLEKQIGTQVWWPPLGRVLLPNPPPLPPLGGQSQVCRSFQSALASEAPGPWRAPGRFHPDSTLTCKAGARKGSRRPPTSLPKPRLHAAPRKCRPCLHSAPSFFRSFLPRHEPFSKTLIRPRGWKSLVAVQTGAGWQPSDTRCSRGCINKCGLTAGRQRRGQVDTSGAGRGSLRRPFPDPLMSQTFSGARSCL